MKYLYNAFKHGPDRQFLWTDAKWIFKTSISIQKEAVKDFISLYYIGLIHSKSTKLSRPAKGRKLFCKVQHGIIVAEHAVGGTNFSKIFYNSNKTFSLGASRSISFAADAGYIQAKSSQKQ